MDENLPNKVDRLFAESLQLFKTDPSEQVWKNIEYELDAADKRKVYRPFVWKKYVTAAGLLIAFLSAVVFVHNGKHTGPDQEFINPVTVESNGFEPARSAAEPARSAGERERGAVGLESSAREKKLTTSLKTAHAEVVGRQSTTLSSHTFGKLTANKRSFNYKVKKNQSDIFDADLLPPESDPVSCQCLSVSSIRVFREPVSINISALPLSIIPAHQSSLIRVKTRLKDRFSFSPYFSKEFVGYTLSDNDLYGANGKEIEQHERNVFSASVGFFINYRINKHWELQSGISYSWSNSHIDSGTSYAVKDNSGEIQYKLNTISGFGLLKSSSVLQPNLGDSVSTAKAYSQLHYLTVPLLVSYRFPLGKFRLLAGAGVSFNVLTGAEIETTTYGNGNAGKEYSVNMMGLKKVNYGLIVKLDLEYPINSKLAFNLIPSFKNTLSPINLETPVTAYPYNFGIGAGFTYQF